MKNGFNNIMQKNKKILKQKNINLNSKHYLILLIISLVNPISENKSRYQNTYYSEIELVIKGNGTQSFLYPNFYKRPSNVFVNGKGINAGGQSSLHLEGEKNTIKLRFEGQIETCRLMFYNLENITEINLSNFDASKVTNMYRMFNGCSNLEKIEFGNINTSSLENMYSLFENCSKITSVNLSNFNISKVKDMSYMFNACSNLEKIEFGNINTSSLETMRTLFQSCDKLTSVDLSLFDTSKVKDMSFMFNQCTNLEKVVFGNINTSSLEAMKVLFNNCNKLTSINLSNFDTSKVTDMSYLFLGCSNLKHINLSNFRAENLNLTAYMFSGCSSLIYLNLYSLKLNKSKNINIPLNGFSPNIKYCIHDTETKNNLLGPDIISICSDTCIDEKNIKIDINNNKCIYLCINSNNKYDFNNICYERCPNGTIMNNFTCIENECNDIENSENCFNRTPKGYYLDLTEQIYKQCFENCDYCNGPGNETINNCIKCKNNFILLNDSLYESNCYEVCKYFYYFDEFNKYHCTENKICPEKYNKYIKNKNKCINKCKRDSLYRYDLNNSCVEKCPNETYILMNDDEYYCVKNIPKGYYFDSNDGIYKECYKTCSECSEKGDEINNNCIECKSNFSFHDNNLNIINFILYFQLL